MNARLLSCEIILKNVSDIKKRMPMYLRDVCHCI